MSHSRHTPAERLALLTAHDALPTTADRAAFRLEHGLGRSTVANWRTRSGLNPTTCQCGADLPTGRRRRCDACIARSAKERRVAAAYGLMASELAALEERSGGVCEACGQPPAVSGAPTQRWLHIDHDHATGRVRGLLCHPCNLTLGYADESLARLAALVDYLARV